MGAPGLTYFCENGHIVLNVPHHYIMDDPIRCPYCGSNNIRTVWEWEDPDYGPHCVSYNPMGTEPHMIQIPVYDVSELFKED